ncbi:MAG: tRNA (guanosine(37)-N1)-methyltransferase TrmD [Akkermansiaceae bacterium]|nr:tRNA (guanosine(37)-N1)-methyltransferase TrmD [Akkermansiaceae bacterium]
MRIDIVTLFPEIALAPLGESIIKRAQVTGIVEIHAHNLRDWARDRHRKTDDYLCGGGPGMLLKPEPLFAAVEDLRGDHTRVILTTPQGKPFVQAEARRLSGETHLLFLCGHYEGVDHRVIEEVVDEEISIGDYVLTNGALAAAVICDAVIRLLPGALGDERSPEDESFSDPDLLEAPAYTKPIDFRGLKVPDVLLSGHHAEIEKWKRERALERTRRNRPDLLARRQAPEESDPGPPGTGKKAGNGE